MPNKYKNNVQQAPVNSTKNNNGHTAYTNKYTANTTKNNNGYTAYTNKYTANTTTTTGPKNNPQVVKKETYTYTNPNPVTVTRYVSKPEDVKNGVVRH